MTGASPIPPASVRSRFVEGSSCAAARVVPGLVPDQIASFAVGSTVTIGSDGTTLEDISLWIGGPKKSLTIDASGLHPLVSASVKMKIEVDPESIFFQSNSFMTEWKDGHEAVLGEEIKFMGGENTEEDVNTMNNLPFSYRWSIASITNVKKARISLQMVPCSLEALDELPDPFSPDLKVSTVYAENVMWASLPSSSWSMPGGFPAFLDRRSVECRGQGVLPSSWKIKNYLYRFYVDCVRNPSLTEEEAAGLILDPTSPPPTDPGKSTRAMWAPLSPEGETVSSGAGSQSRVTGATAGGSGSSPAAACSSEPTTGLPPMFNKTTAAIQAKESLNRQSGITNAPTDTFEEIGDDVLSAEGEKMRRMMTIAFRDTLPSDLPSWDDLATLDAKSVIAIINTKISCESGTMNSLLCPPLKRPQHPSTSRLVKMTVLTSFIPRGGSNSPSPCQRSGPSRFQ